ncbi:MAG TPA: hypothetical protein VHA52_04085, partial [Candidatus Babeliaceae bacterium]|nr:hypothetical protein [Candidatus Babeliaceae bacterium]
AKEEGKDGQTLAPDSAEYSATLDRFESLKEIVFRMASSISPDLVLKGLGYGLGSLVLWKGIQTLRDIMGYGINPLTLLVLPFQVLGVISIMYGRTIYNVEQGIIAVSAVLVALAGAYTLLTQAEEEARAGKLTDKEAVIIEQKVKSILTNSEQSFQV